MQSLTRTIALAALCGLNACSSCDESSTSPPTPASSRSGLRPDTPDLAPSASLQDARTSTATSPPDWPAFPSSALDAQKLADVATSRPGFPADPPDGRALVTAFTRAIERGEAISGWPAVHAFFGAWQKRAAAAQKSAWLVIGTHHDSSEQMRAFGEIVGPLAEPRFARVALEQLHADGRWVGLARDGDASGLAPDVQGGDDALLSAWEKTGDEGSLRAIARSQEQSDYVAWKYGYVAQVLGVLANARAAGETLVGCDMPPALRARLPKDLDEPTASHVRELHCARALVTSLRDAPRPHATAVLWGEAHVGAAAFPRYLPREDEVLAVRLIGARASATEPDATVEKRFVAADPVLVDRGDDVLLLLPDAPLSRHVDRARIDDGAGVTAIELSSTRPVHARIGTRDIRVDKEVLPIPVVNGHVTLAVDLGARTVLTALDVEDGSRVEVHVDDAAPELRIVHHTRAASSGAPRPSVSDAGP